MSNIVIKVDNLSKLYRIGEHLSGKSTYITLRDVIANSLTVPFNWIKNSINQIQLPSSKKSKVKYETIWALKDVSFEIKQGEVVGIIGRNGAGKSTLLKILSCITEPTEGRAKIIGRIVSLLEVGTGFHPELTGRENIFLNGAILGMKKREIVNKFDEIVAFAEVEKFIDTPVKFYSSGMYVRLAFAVAAHLEPEILLVDEVLAVGDAMFQKKCLGKMDVVAKQGRTVLLVSHNMAAIQNLCKRAVVLENGRLVKADSADTCVRFYLDQFNREEDVDLSHRGDRRGTGKIRITKVFFERDGKIALNVQTGKPCSICFDYQAEEAQKNISVAFTVRDERAQFLFRPSTEDTGYNFNCVPGRGVFRCNIEKLPLVPGRYRITTRVIANHEEADYIEGAAFLFVEKGDFFGTGRLNTHSPVLIEHAWELA